MIFLVKYTGGKNMYSIKKDDIVIRTMQAKDVASYIAKFNYSPQKRNMFYTAVKKNVTQRKDDEPNLYFVILKDNKVIGGIAAIAFEKSLCDAIIKIDLPGKEMLMGKVKNLFVELARETYFFDDIYFEKGINVLGQPILSKVIPIADPSRW